MVLNDCQTNKNSQRLKFWELKYTLIISLAYVSDKVLTFFWRAEL